jgi:hypothetical protein
MPAEDPPGSAAFLSPTGKHQPTLRDLDIEFISSESLGVALARCAKPFCVGSKQFRDLTLCGGQ